MHRFYARPDQFQKEAVVLSEGETRHLRDVLRIRTGDEASVFDGLGREFLCRVDEIGKTSTRLSVTAEIEPAAPESPLDLTVAAAVTPAEKFDLAIQKAVELGVRRFIPLLTDRCEIRASAADKRADRWRRIAFEAAKQCGRARLMDVLDTKTFDGAIRMPGVKVLFSERDGTPIDAVERVEALTVFFGPKGGWSDDELVLARDSGANVVTLGGRILRAETAVIAITAILQNKFGDMY